MLELKDFKHQIHSCSKCGLCQAQCPIYKITGNDCSVSRGQFVMLSGLLNGKLKMSKTINKYLDLCLKCGACTKFCPSGINVVDVIIAAKSEYFKTHLLEKLISQIQKHLIFGLIPNLINIFHKKTKSQKFDKKVVYFGGCASKLKGNNSVIKILNKLNIEVITPNFNCCGISLFIRGDIKGFSESASNFIKILQKENITEIVTTCASCEKSLKDYSKWIESDQDKEFLRSLKIKNIYEYIKENNLKLELKQPVQITYHKPCNINNFSDIEWILQTTKNLEYIPMENFDSCCGLNGITKINEYKTMQKIFESKRNNILKTGSKQVLTSCLGCETALKYYSLNQYSTSDLIDFLARNIR